MGEFGTALAFVAILFLIFLLIEYWYIIILVIAIAIIAFVILCSVESKKMNRINTQKKKEAELKKKEAERKEQADLLAIKSKEAEYRKIYANRSNDATKMVLEYVIRYIKKYISELEAEATKAPAYQEVIGRSLELNVYMNSFYINILEECPFFDNYSRKNIFKDMIEANAVSYSVLRIAVSLIDDIPPKLPILANLYQKELTLDNQWEIRPATITLTAQNPNYKNGTAWKQTTSSLLGCVSKSSLSSVSKPNSSSTKSAASLTPKVPDTTIKKSVKLNDESFCVVSTKAFLRRESDGKIYTLSSSTVTLGQSNCDILGGYAYTYAKFTFMNEKWYISNILSESQVKDGKKGVVLRSKNKKDQEIIPDKYSFAVLNNEDKIILRDEACQSTYTFLLNKNK